MNFVFWVLGLIAFVALCFFGFGLYEFIVDTRHDCKRRDFHLKHLDDINHDRK